MRYFLITNSGITVCKDSGDTLVIPTSHINYDKIKELVMDTDNEIDDETIFKLAQVMKNIIKFSKGFITIGENGNGLNIAYKGNPIAGALSTRILELYKKDGKFEHFLDFYTNMMSNPRPEAVEELYDFLNTSDLPITEDGCFLAYKLVDKDFKDIYTHKMDNSVGSLVKMERKDVDNNRRNQCSQGLHFAAYGYLTSYGSGNTENNVIIVKINPRDVVAIPEDYNHMKGRCCEYTVIGAIENHGQFIKPNYVNTKDEDITTSVNSWDELEMDENEEFSEPDIYEDMEDMGDFVDHQENVFENEDEDFDNDIFEEDEKEEELSLDSKIDVILDEAKENNYHEFKAVLIESNGAIKAGIRIDDVTPGSSVTDVVQSYIFRRGSISETLGAELYENGFSLKPIRPTRRINTSDKNRPCVLVSSIDGIQLNKLTVYTPKENTIEVV